MQEKIAFVHTGFIALLRRQLGRDFPAGRWGKMNFQQMVEHLVLAVKSANGKVLRPQVTPDEHIPKWHAFLRDDEKQFRENTKSPSFPEEPLPIHFATPDMAIDKLEQEIDTFFEVYRNQPGLTIVNPVFGALDFDHAVNLLYKHFQHHARQFGLCKD